MHAIHLGPGLLGLGLVVTHLVEEMELPVYVAGKPLTPGEPPEPRCFLLSLVGSGQPQRQVCAASAGNPVALRDLPDEVRGWVADDTPLIVTSALKEKIAERRAFVEELLAARPPGAETLLIACENVPHETYAALGESHPAAVVAPAVVDRICIEPNGGKRTADGRRQVEAHEVWEWVVEIEDGRLPRLRRALEASGIVVCADLRPYKDRKLWLVNGLHQVLALTARELGTDSLPAAAATPRFQRASRPITASMRAALSGRWPLLETLPGYVDDRIRAFEDMREKPDRILADHLQRSDLTSLIERLDARVFDAARATKAHRLPTAPYELVVELLLRILADEPKLYPSSRPRVPDAVVVGAFAAALEGWYDPARASAIVDQFERTLLVTA